MNFFKTSSPAPAQTDPEANFSAPVNVATANTSVRVNFLRKVYTLLTINFLITIAVSCAFAFIIPVREFIVERRWLIVVALIVAVVALIALSCVKLAFPTNLIMMYVFVLAFSVTIGVIVASYYDNGYGPIVIQAFAATAAVFFAITAYILVTKKDFSFLYGFLGAALFVLIVLSIINFAFNATTGGRSRAFSFGISVAGYVVACVCFSALERLIAFADRFSVLVFVRRLRARVCRVCW